MYRLFILSSFFNTSKLFFVVSNFSGYFCIVFVPRSNFLMERSRLIENEITFLGLLGKCTNDI